MDALRGYREDEGVSGEEGALVGVLYDDLEAPGG